MRKLMTAAVAALALLSGMGVAVAAGTTDPDTIVAVEGDAANGFGIHYYDGSARFPPTDSEARAECGEYDTYRARVRCRTPRCAPGTATWPTCSDRWSGPSRSSRRASMAG